MILPNSWLGLLGGGQLGKMFAIKAQQIGYKVMVIDPNEDSPAKGVATEWICADYTDKAALEIMSSKCVAVTTEFENVPFESLEFLGDRIFVSPNQQAVRIIQDRILEKEFLVSNGLNTVPFVSLRKFDDLKSTLITDSLFPGLLKLSRFGYDGKGQIRVTEYKELKKAFESFDGKACVFEKEVKLRKEISVVLVRGKNGKKINYPLAENKHQNGILDTSIVPAKVEESTHQEAIKITEQIAESLNYIGVICVEFFVSNSGELLVNEIAPRPHNSGHYTLDACSVCQFEQQVRAMCNLPLAPVFLNSPAAVMVNLLGEIWNEGEPNWSVLLNSPSVNLHLYGKKEARKGRKMGHFTVLADQLDIAVATAKSIRRSLSESGVR